MPHFPKFDLGKFDESNLTRKVNKMEHHFSLDAIANNLLKLSIGVLYLNMRHFSSRNCIKNHL
jgi:hypothetical protein